MMTSRYDADARAVTFVFSGHMDTVQSGADAGAVEEALAEAMRAQPAAPDRPLQAVFDLKAVDFVSSAFFRICLGAAKQVRKGNFTVTNARPAVTQLFKIAGMDEFIGAL